MTEGQLTTYLKQAADLRHQELLRVQTSPDYVARELGRAVAQAIVDLPKLFPEQIYGTGGLAFLAKANVNVDYNRYALNPSYTITVEWNNQ